MPRTPRQTPQEPQDGPAAVTVADDPTPPVEDPHEPHTGDPVPGVPGGFYLDHDELPPADRGRVSALDAEWQAAQRDEHPLTVWEAIAEVTRQVRHIAKEGTADARSGGYRFRGIDQVLEALHPILGDVGLLIVPGEVVEARWETRATSGGGTLNVARLRVRYTLVGPDGSTMTGEAWGEGGDSGDKATQKAHSQSYKSFTLQLFSIPTEQSAADEPDATNPASRPYSREEIDRATNAARAADDTETIEALAGVRRRALALLDVPVPLEDGSIAPLSVLFDQRRAVLERDAR